MADAVTMRRKVQAFGAMALGAVGYAAAALAQSAPDGENGRYALSPTAEGVVRLDTRTGVASHCSDKGGGWVCTAMPDEHAAFDAELGRMQAQIETLKKDNAALGAQLAERGGTVGGRIDEPLAKGDALRTPEIKSGNGERKLEIPLPSDRDLDRAMTFLENAWRRLIDMATRVQKDVSGKSDLKQKRPRIAPRPLWEAGVVRSGRYRRPWFPAGRRTRSPR